MISVNEKSPIAYFFEVDLEYSDQLHELHNDYLLAPEKLLFQVIYCRNIVKKLLENMK